MDLLPGEMLLEIFQYLSPADLLPLTVLSRTFNEVISGSKLVHKLELNFRKLNSDEATLGLRRYSQLVIGFFNVRAHHAILQDIGADIVSLTFKNCKLKLDVLRKVLNATPNVTKLTFDKLKLSDVPNEMKQPLPSLSDLVVSSIESDPRLFRVLNKCTAIELKLKHSSSDGIFYFTDFNQFLKHQKQLKSFVVEGMYKTSLFTDDSLNKVCFQLESFSVRNSFFQQTVHLKSFIEGQAETLTHFEASAVEQCDFSTVLNQMKQLKRLKVSDILLNYLESLPTVETLEVIGNKLYDAIYEKTPNVKHLKLKWVKKGEALHKVDRCMSNLESLEVTEGSIDGLLVPTLKRLELRRASDQCPGFFNHSRDIEHLTLENCSFVNDEYFECVAKSCPLLTSLTITGCDKLTNKSLALLGESCSDLKMIRVDGAKEKLDWQLLPMRKDLIVFI